MRPIRLELEGFTSFRQKAEIDFGGLDLFAIAGPTGSGKTSILDAITYALYGETSRLGGRGLAELISLGAPRLSVMLDFEAGGRRYRIARVLKRAGTATVRLETLEKDGAHPFDGGARETAAEIARIVGLDFEAFTKAVVLPQGKFDEFLRGEAKKRREILEALLNLGVYREMMKLANARRDEQQSQRNLLAEQLEREYADATEERRQGLAAEIDRLAAESERWNAELLRVEGLRLPALELRQKRESASAAEHERGAAAEELERERRRESELAARMLREQEELERLREEWQRTPYDESRHQQLIALLPLAQQLDKTETGYAAMVRQSSEKAVVLAVVEKKLETAAKDLEAAGGKLRAAEDAHAEAKEKFAALTAKYGGVDLVNHVAGEIERLAALAEQFRCDREEYGSLEKKQRDLAMKLEKLAAEETLAQKACAEARETYEALRQRHSAAELRSHLKPGEPCPVCEQVVARPPKRIPAARLEQAREAAEKQEQAFGNVRQRLAAAKAEADALPREMQKAKTAADRTSAQIQEVKAKAERVLGKPPGTDAAARLKRIAGDLRASEALCCAKEEEVRKAAGAATTAKDAVTGLDRNAAVLKRDMQSLAEQIESARGDIETLRARLGGAPAVKIIQDELTAQQDAKRQRASIEETIGRKLEAREEAQEQARAANTRVAVLRERIALLDQAIERSKSEAARIQEKLREKLAGMALPEGADEAERIESLAAALRARYAESGRQKSQAQLQLDQVVIRMAEAEKKRLRAGELEASARLYGQLATLLRANEFIEYILEDAFRLLCTEGARQLLTLSQGRYSFHTDGNDFQVIDHWNADERRSVRTLSGGESFLASLALALALSSSVSQFSGGGPFRLDALFLDEGFSTLDTETLNIAVEAIESLQQGDRMIGVISHVADLADRLPGRILVIKGVSGSEIRMDGFAAAVTT